VTKKKASVLMINPLLKRLLVCVMALLAHDATQAAPQFEDSMAQRTLACAACHGREGRAGPDGYYPRIAGKPGGYLYNQLLNFRDGRRHYALMAGMVDPLSEPYLMEIAQYFGALDLPYAPPSAKFKPPADLVARGETLVLRGDAARKLPACVRCHGLALTGVLPNIPGLVGLPHDYLNAQLGAWRTGQRRAHAPDCMADIAKALAADEVAAVTAWLATRPMPADTHPVPALPGDMPMQCGSAPQPKPVGSPP
jgi:cytochrome c553